MNFLKTPESATLSDRVDTQFAPSQLHSLEHWKVIRHLGSGSTAHVWLMQHLTHKETIACKTPKTEEDVGVLSQEAELAHTLSHQNLVRYLPPNLNMDLPTFDPEVGTFWEYLPGGSLANLVAAGGQISLNQTVTVMLPMVQVAQQLHAEQVIHGDISPRNILFDMSGRPVLIDLGSTRASAHWFARTGTPGFMAPELKDGHTSLYGLGSSADVYSIAATSWFCLTGETPGPTESRVPLVTLRSSLNAQVINILEACLVDEPALRPSMEQLLQAVGEWAIPEPVDLYPAVKEDEELLLPTRQSAVDTTRNRCRWGWGKLRKPSANLRSSRVAKSSKTAAAKPIARRILLATGTLALLGGAGATVVLTPSADQHDTVTDTDPGAAKATDFQAVVDGLAKDRSEAWTVGDPKLVESYAVTDSMVFRDDVALLGSLNERGETLDAIRMRAAVGDVEQSQDFVVVHVEWRMDGYSQLDADGEVLAAFDSRTDQLKLELVETTGEWKIARAEAI